MNTKLNRNPPILNIICPKSLKDENKSTKRIRRYTLAIFLERAKEIHGNKIDYSRVTEEDINQGGNSKVPLKCNVCQHEWISIILSHIYRKSGCPECSGRVRWNLPRFIKKSKEIHSNKIDYSQITEGDINGYRSRIPIKCNSCQYEYISTIDSHIYGKADCQNCAGNAPWTLDHFLKRAKEIHGDKIDYSHVSDKHINGSNSEIPLKCNICQYEWTPSIGGHINAQSGCPDCSGNVPWTLNRFLERAREIHGDKIDYAHVSDEHINGNKCKVPLKCNICKYEWSPPIITHIYHKTGCPNCAGKVPWTLNRFLERAKEIHGDKIDYSHLDEKDINNGCESRVPLKCNTCKCEWSPCINAHINAQSGCPNCSHRSYSKACIDWLKSIEASEGITIQCAISPEGEFRIPSPNNRHYKLDGYCQFTNTVYEYHGDYWHGNPVKFDPDDINKTIGKSYGELYRKTIERENYIRSLGYNLIVRWETPFKNVDI